MSDYGQTAKGRSSAESHKSSPAQPVEGMDTKAQARRFTDVQGASRFPIKLPVAVKSQTGPENAETRNISANGVLFQIESDMPIGSMIDFTISFPADVVGSDSDVRVDCRGRVVRTYEDEGRRGVGVVIDEYRFER
jgi:PilZ domain